MAFEAMFQPIQIGKLTIRNRVLSTAHAEVYATDGGMTTDRYIKYYEEKAKGGIGLAICGGSSVVALGLHRRCGHGGRIGNRRLLTSTKRSTRILPVRGRSRSSTECPLGPLWNSLTPHGARASVDVRHA